MTSPFKEFMQFGEKAFYEYFHINVNMPGKKTKVQGKGSFLFQNHNFCKYSESSDVGDVLETKMCYTSNNKQ